MDQTGLVRVVSNVGQDFIDSVHPLLHNLHVEAEESLAATWVNVSGKDIVFVPPSDRPGTP